jgi:hypothetical protein
LLRDESQAVKYQALMFVDGQSSSRKPVDVEKMMKRAKTEIKHPVYSAIRILEGKSKEDTNNSKISLTMMTTQPSSTINTRKRYENFT